MNANAPTMTPAELYKLILYSGRTVQPDVPERGRLTILPPPGEDLSGWIRSGKDALLAYARDLERVAEDEKTVSGPSKFVVTPEYARERGFKDGDIVEITTETMSPVVARCVIEIEKDESAMGDEDDRQANDDQVADDHLAETKAANPHVAAARARLDSLGITDAMFDTQLRGNFPGDLVTLLESPAAGEAVRSFGSLASRVAAGEFTKGFRKFRGAIVGSLRQWWERNVPGEMPTWLKDDSAPPVPYPDTVSAPEPYVLPPGVEGIGGIMVPAGSMPTEASSPSSFPFGHNAPLDPDGEAADLLDEIRGTGRTVSLDPADRTKIRIDPPIDPAIRPEVVCLKSALLILLEREGRDAELSAAPSPFRQPGVGRSDVEESGVRVEPDRLDSLADVPLVPGTTGEGEGLPTSEIGGGKIAGQSAEGGGGNPEGGEGEQGGGVAESLSYRGYMRCYTKPPKKKTQWRHACDGVTWKACWTTLLEYAKESEESALECVVFKTGKTP